MNNIKNPVRHIWTFSLVLFWAHLGFAQNSFTLQQAIEYGWSNKTDIANGKLAIEDAQQQIVERKAIGIPQVNATVGQNYFLKKPTTLLPESFGIDPTTGQLNPEFEREVSFVTSHDISGSIEATTLLFNWTYLQGLKAARMYKTYAEEDYQATRKKVEDDITNAFLPVLLVNESEITLDKNKANIERLLTETREIFKAGFAEKLDVDRLELSLANIQVDLDNLYRQREMAIQALKYAIGMPLEEDLTVTGTIDEYLTIINDDLLLAEVDYLTLPQYRVLEATERLNEVNIKGQEAAYYPSLSAFGNYQMQWQGDEFNDLFYTPSSIIGLQLQVPIFAGFGSKAKVERAKIQLQTLRNTKDDFKRGINLQHKTAHIAYQNALHTLTNRKKNLNLAQSIYDTTQIKYKEGVGSSLELNQAEMSLYQAQQNVIAANYDLLVAKISLKQILNRTFE